MMEKSTAELMDVVHKIHSGELTFEEAFEDLPEEERERVELILVEPDGTLKAIEPVDWFMRAK